MNLNRNSNKFIYIYIYLKLKKFSITFMATFLNWLLILKILTFSRATIVSSSQLVGCYANGTASADLNCSQKLVVSLALDNDQVSLRRSSHFFNLNFFRV